MVAKLQNLRLMIKFLPACDERVTRCSDIVSIPSCLPVFRLRTPRKSQKIEKKSEKVIFLTKYLEESKTRINFALAKQR